MSETPVTKSVCFGIITGGQMHVETAACVIQSVVSLSTIAVPSTLVIIKGCYVHRNRNEAIQRARKTGATHILFVDTDMVFDKSAVTQLLAADKDIVGANYNKRMLPQTPIVKEEIKELSQVEFVPTGLMLIKLSIFDTLPEPWFYYDPPTATGDQGVTDDDKFFCRAARNAGFEVWCDPTIHVGHIGEFIY